MKPESQRLHAAPPGGGIADLVSYMAKAHQKTLSGR